MKAVSCKPSGALGVLRRKARHRAMLDVVVSHPWIGSCMPHFASFPGSAAFHAWQNEQAWIPELAANLSKQGMFGLQNRLSGCSAQRLLGALSYWGCEHCVPGISASAAKWKVHDGMHVFYDCCLGIFEPSNCDQYRDGVPVQDLCACMEPLMDITKNMDTAMKAISKGGFSLQAVNEQLTLAGHVGATLCAAAHLFHTNFDAGRVLQPARGELQQQDARFSVQNSLARGANDIFLRVAQLKSLLDPTTPEAPGAHTLVGYVLVKARHRFSFIESGEVESIVNVFKDYPLQGQRHLAIFDKYAPIQGPRQCRTCGFDFL
eukprot:5496186-Amphidinium_carterae.1